MYGFFDESGSTSNAVGFTESSMVVQEDTGPCLSDRPNQVLQRHIKDVKYRGNNSSQAIASELDEFLRCDDNTGREMVAQDMAESYNELFHTAQEPQEFHSVDELGPRAHQSVSTSDTSAHLYVSAQGDSQSQQSEPQQRTYYNLSTLSDSSSIYFGDIRQSGSSRLQAGEALASKATPGAPLSPARADIYQEHQSASKSDYNNSSCNSNITSVTTLDGKNNNGNANDVCQRSRPVITSSPHLRRFAPTSLSRRGSASIIQSSSSSHREHLHHHHHHHHHHRHHQHQESVHSGARSTDLAEDYPTTKKRKISLHDENDLLEDTTDDSKSARTSAGNKKQNHSEIEKRRRDKMNTYITELSSLVPMCHAMSRKLDKLTVLRMAVQHIKTILGAANSYTEGHYKPAFLSDQELKTLILQAADGFVFVVGCDRGRILYVSESVSQTLNYSQDDLLGQSWFDILHPKDVAKVKEQLSSSDLSPRERLIDAKTMLPVKTDVPQGMSRLCSGARRSFFCRMKRKVESSCGESQVKEEAETTTGCHRTKKQQNADWKYSVIQCTGYLKSWAPAKIGLEEEEGSGDGEASNLSSLVAVGRVQPNLTALTPGARMPRLRTIEFVSRHAIDGKFLFVDQRATLVLGFLPQELLGTSMYEYYHHDDIPHLAESHKAALQTSERVNTQVYRFRVKGASFVRLQSEWKSFKNPWTKDIEYLIAKNSAVFYNARQVESTAYRSDGSSVQGNYDYFTQSNGGLERLISSHVEVSKIGRRIAKEALDHQKRCEDSSSTSSPNPAQDSVLLNTEITTTTSSEGIHDAMEAGVGSDNSSSNISPTYHHIRNNVTLNSMINDQGAVDTMMDIIGSNVINESSDPLPSDGNDEAAMAVIMSLLEADAGLGGPVDFSGLPWPLP